MDIIISSLVSWFMRAKYIIKMCSRYKYSLKGEVDTSCLVESGNSAVIPMGQNIARCCICHSTVSLSRTFKAWPMGRCWHCLRAASRPPRGRCRVHFKFFIFEIIRKITCWGEARHLVQTGLDGGKAAHSCMTCLVLFDNFIRDCYQAFGYFFTCLVFLVMM